MILGSGQRLGETRGLGGSTVNRFKHFKDKDPSVLKVVTKMGCWAKKTTIYQHARSVGDIEG
jgi:hypothetical protein